MDRVTRTLVVVHTYISIDENNCNIRIISARKATKREQQIYNEGQKMKKEYDFSKGIRGKFYRKDAIFHLPIYLEPEVESFIGKRAKEKLE